jgi:DNA polymerase IV
VGPDAPTATRGSRQILHIDMDAFYAAVEQRDDPSLRGRPVLVGGPSRRGVVAAASYEARTFGVHSAMPMAEALRRCPEAVVLSGRHGHYGEVSQQMFGVLSRFTPLVEGLSLDEAFLDVTHSQSLFGSGQAIARAIKEAILEEIGLTASAGVAPCKFAAKIASDLDKPDGLVVVPDDVAGFLAPLPVERMWGVGPKATERLHRAGLRRIGDLARSDRRSLESLLGKSWGAHVFDLARGIDDRAVVPGRDAVSIGAEETFDHDVTDRSELERRLLRQSARVARRLIDGGLVARAVAIKVKYGDFTAVTRRVTLPEPVGDTDSIFRAARALLDRVELAGAPVRLTGVSVSGLTAGAGSLEESLFPSESAVRRRRLEEVTAQVAKRFGDKRITRAELLGGGLAIDPDVSPHVAADRVLRKKPDDESA